MLKLDISRGGLFAAYEGGGAEFSSAGIRTGSRAARLGRGIPLQRTVEVQFRFGGQAPRALLGAEFAPSAGANISFDVGYTEEFGDTHLGELYRWPLIIGLVDEFASPVLEELLGNDTPWPPGRLTVNRAAFDEVESSAWAFGKAANVLAHVFSATFSDRNVDTAIRDLVATW
jgi:hypothetical protein